MAITHHPRPESLMSCSAGSMPEAFAAVMASHIAMCRVCQKDLALMEKIGVALFDQIAPAKLDAAAPVMTLRRREADGDAAQSLHPSTEGDMPEPLVPLLGRYLDKVKWKTLAPGVSYVSIPLSHTGRGDLRLMKIAPGHAVPEHGHGGSELTLLLRGAYEDKMGRYSAGDVADMGDDDEHQPTADANEGCVCLVASDRKLRFKSLIARLVQPFTGM